MAFSPGELPLIWQWIEALLQIAAPESFAHLYPGTTEQQVQAVETALSLPLPDDLLDGTKIGENCMIKACIADLQANRSRTASAVCRSVKHSMN